MKKWTYRIRIGLLVFGAAALIGCSRSQTPAAEEKEPVNEEIEAEESEEILLPPEREEEMPSGSEAQDPEVISMDWSGYFDGLNGAAVVYDATAGRYLIYNEELARIRRSPCSTFKIVSSLAALEDGLFHPEQSTRTWSGEIFWNEQWNRDIDFPDAFRASCVWYFREVIDEIGQERMQEVLEELSYGNCDISDWEGRLNTNNNNRALTGFWIESSLLISPREQTEVMERIFGEDSVCSEETRRELKKVMLLEGQEQTAPLIYGKTGMGMAQGIVVNAWFTGFAEYEEKEVYFCVYLGQKEDRDVSSAAAREIAVRILSEEPVLTGEMPDEKM